MLWLPPAVGVAAAGLALVALAYGPRLGYTLREPTEDERDRLRRLRESVDSPDVPLGIRITSHGEAVGATLLGLPGRRTLVVSDAALDHLDDEQLRALLAIEVERGRAGIEVIQALVTGVALGIVTAAYVAPIPFFEAMLGGWMVVLGGVALVRRRYYAADAAAGDLVGSETVRAAIEHAATLRGASLDPGGRWSALFEVEPSVGARLERLADGTERSP